MWGPSGKATKLTVSGQISSQALAINNAGFSVGWAQTATGIEAVRWAPDGTG